MTSIVLTADDNYLRYIPTLLVQIARFGRRADGVTLAVPAGLTGDHIAPVKAAASIHDIGLTVVPLPERDHEQISCFTPIRDGQHASHFTYVRLLLPALLPDLDDVLYLDVDTMIRAPIDELLDWDLRHPLGAVPELAGTAAHLFGTPRAPYFNAGVLRMSLERMRNEQLWDRSRRILETRPEVRWFDQDVLNLVFHDRFDSLPLTYNVSDMIVRKYPGLTVLEDPVIVHFNGPVKPWHPSATSPHARAWRRYNSEAGVAAHCVQAASDEHDPDVDAGTSRHFAGYRQARTEGRGHLVSLVRAVLPADARKAAKGAATEAVDRALCRMEEIRAALDAPRLHKKEVPPRVVGSHPATTASLGEDIADYGLDLLISIARSGTNAFGDVIEQSRPDVNWMNEMYLGAEWTNLADGELLDRFPWFSNGGPEAINDVPPTERGKAFDSFAATMSSHVVELTRAVLENQTGRTLIKVFPDQLHPSAFEALLKVFRPRLLVLRRELIFTYVSQLRAIRLDERERGFGKAWLGQDLTEAPYAISDRAALHYALRCDAWFDRLDRLAAELGLTNVWLTYTGLFTTGADIPRLQSFYPGPTLPTGDGSGGLQSGLTIQDRRSDASVLGMIKAVSNLSATTQAHLLRLPGHHMDCS